MHHLSSPDFTIHLADDSLIMSQRLSAWTGHGPALEQDIALTNIALDMLGQARHFYQYAAECINGQRLLKQFVPTRAYPVDEDDLAYHRLEHQFRTHLLIELPNGDWAQTILKLFIYSLYKKALYEQLLQGNDAQLAAIAEKSLKEVKYHIRWSRDWVLRMGDGTEESHHRSAAALDYLWPYTGELFEQPDWFPSCTDHRTIEYNWLSTVRETLEDATLILPPKTTGQSGGLRGVHTEYLGYILAEMQYLQRIYPGNEW